MQALSHAMCRAKGACAWLGGRKKDYHPSHTHTDRKSGPCHPSGCYLAPCHLSGILLPLSLPTVYSRPRTPHLQAAQYRKKRPTLFPSLSSIPPQGVRSPNLGDAMYKDKFSSIWHTRHTHVCCTTVYSICLFLPCILASCSWQRETEDALCTHRSWQRAPVGVMVK